MFSADFLPACEKACILYYITGTNNHLTPASVEQILLFTKAYVAVLKLKKKKKEQVYFWSPAWFR